MSMVVAIPDRQDADDDRRDEVLAARATVDLHAFGVLYERYGKRVHRYIRSHVPDDATADDLTAHTFYRALVSADTYRGEGSYKSWIFRIARNTLATWHARASAKVETPYPVLPDEIDDNASPLVATMAGEERAAVRQIVDELPEAQREVVRLRYWTDLSIDEIAQTTRRSSNAVRQLLHRARRQLKRTLSRKDLTILLGATGASALAAYSLRRHRKGDG